MRDVVSASETGKPVRVFVVGCPRSGTTLAQSLIASHPDLVTLPETHFLPSVEESSWGWRRLMGFASDEAELRLRSLAAELNLDRNSVPSGPSSIRGALEAYVALLDAFAERRGARGWVEKTPRHLHYIALLEQHGLDAYFVHVIRNGDDVVRSLYAATQRYPNEWGGDRSLVQCADRWLGDAELSLRYIEQERHVHVLYDDLVSDPNESVARTWEKLGVREAQLLRSRFSEASDASVPDESPWQEVGSVIRHSTKTYDEILPEKRWQQTLAHLAREVEHRGLYWQGSPLLSSDAAIQVLPEGTKTATNVAVFPDWKGNPYLEELELRLPAFGYRYVFPEGSGLLFPLVKAIEADDCELVHLHWQHPFIIGGPWWRAVLRSLRFLVQVALVRRSGRPIVWTIHNLVNHERRNARIERLVSALLYRIVDSPVVHCSDVIHEVGREYWLSDRQRGRVKVVAHGNYADAYASCPEKGVAREELDLDPSAVVYLHFGSVREYKNVRNIIKSFSSIPEDSLRLRIAGAGSTAALRELVRRDRRISVDARRIPEQDVPKYFAASDVFVYAGSGILMSGAVMLAMSLGIAIVAPRTGCLPAVLGREGCVWYGEEHGDDLTRALEEVFSRDLTSMGRANRERAERYSWDESAAKLRAIFDTVRSSSERSKQAVLDDAV